MTPVRLQGIHNSPLKLMSKRNIRGILPTRKQESNIDDYERMKSRRQEQAKHHKGTEYDIIPMGQVFCTMSIIYLNGYQV